MTPEQKQAYEWAKKQNYTSVAARYAKVLADLVDELSTRNESKPVALARWIPVTERKPEDGAKVLVSVRGRDESLIGWYDADWEDWVVEEGLSEKKLMPVTHWQEKPLPATEGKE